MNNIKHLQDKRNKRLEEIAKSLGREKTPKDLYAVYDNAYTDGFMQVHFTRIDF